MIVVAGENVADLVPAGGGRADRSLLRLALGGGPANVAVAAARLGVPVAMAARLGHDALGARFRARLVESGVDTRYLVDTVDPSALALATVGPGGDARYDFWLTGAADFGWRDGQLPPLAPGDTLHIGSLAALLPPGADAIERWATVHRPQCTVTFDPNLRPAALNRPDSLVRLERLVRLAHVVKASDDDVRLAYPRVDPVATARRWLDTGPGMVVLTHGAAGATALTRGTQVSVPAPRVDVVDTIGAGAAAMGALLAVLHRRGGPGVPDDELPEVLRFITAVAALTCTRAGADPPTAAELAASSSSPPPRG
ncbi:MAG TPA: carbohydrate kinase [Micromonosporaceae bacterium]|nr:carbohydrate kinase [Micromonosporaceae bacterium]